MPAKNLKQIRDSVALRQYGYKPVEVKEILKIKHWRQVDRIFREYAPNWKDWPPVDKSYIDALTGQL